jgi:hypothetical protein
MKMMQFLPKSLRANEARDISSPFDAGYVAYLCPRILLFCVTSDNKNLHIVYILARMRPTYVGSQQVLSAKLEVMRSLIPCSIIAGKPALERTFARGSSELLDHLGLDCTMCSDGYAECGGNLRIAAVLQCTDTRKLCTRTGTFRTP